MMAALGPFEAAPHLAAAVSGGGDSMALCLLADDWARRAGGRLSALTVDHGLRPEAPREARRVGAWLTARGIDHHILSRPGVRPTSGLQEAARRLRYGLMTSWCRESGVLHLLLAHNLEDQGETFLLRLGRGSGIDGLSAMAALIETPEVRILRPLLAVERDRLRATLAGYRQDWLEDPSNLNPGFARTGLRAAQPALTGAGLSPARLAATARRMGGVRRVLETAASALSAECCAVYPAGYARLDAAALAAVPGEVSVRILARLLLCIGARDYAPPREKLHRLLGAIARGGPRSARTLGGCRILPRKEGVLVCREGRHPPRPVAAVAGRRLTWDGRFVIDLAADRRGRGFVRPPEPARPGRLGRGGRRAPGAAGRAGPGRRRDVAAGAARRARRRRRASFGLPAPGARAPRGGRRPDRLPTAEQPLGRGVLSCLTFFSYYLFIAPWGMRRPPCRGGRRASEFQP